LKDCHSAFLVTQHFEVLDSGYSCRCICFIRILYTRKERLIQISLSFFIG